MTLASPLPGGASGRVSWVSSIGRGSVSSRRSWRPPLPRRSSRPTTSAASTASRSTATSPRPSAARSRACSADLAGKPAGELRVGLGRDMRLTAPELAARYRDGLVAEGAHVLDAGMVGTEMLYYLVGSRDLDGGLMCTASHNPKAYTGAKLVERGAIALSGDAGIGDIRRLLEAGLGEPPGGGSSEDVDVYAEFQDAALKFIDPSAVRAAEGRARRRQRHGRPDGRPGARAARRPRARPDLLGARRRVPRPRAQPAAAREPRVHHPQGARGGRRPRHRLGRRRRPLLLHRRDGRVRRRRLPDRAAGRVDPPEAPGRRRSSTTSAPRARSPTPSRPRAAARSSTASATRSSRPACATRAASSAARSPATTTSPTSTTPTRARSRRC